jgi:hypothetical protein
MNYKNLIKPLFSGQFRLSNGLSPSRIGYCLAEIWPKEWIRLKVPFARLQKGVRAAALLDPAFLCAYFPERRMCKKEGKWPEKKLGPKVGPKLGNKKSAKGAFFVCLFIRHSGIAQKNIFWREFFLVIFLQWKMMALWTFWGGFGWKIFIIGE